MSEHTPGPREASTLPTPYYNCANASDDESLFPPEALFWVDRYCNCDQPGCVDGAGWYCLDCLSYNDSPPRGPSLLDEIQRRDAGPDMASALVGLLSLHVDYSATAPEQREEVQAARAALTKAAQAKARGELPGEYP